MLFRYAGDLYGDTSSDTGACAGGRPSSACFERGLFADFRPPPVSGISLPEVFFSAFRNLVFEIVFKLISRTVKRAFFFFGGR